MSTAGTWREGKPITFNTIFNEKTQTYTTDLLGKKSQLLFNKWQKAGRIPERFKSWVDIQKAVKAIKAENPKIKGPALAEELGITHQNVLGKRIINAEGLSLRNIRDDLNIVDEDMIFATGGQKAVDEYKARVKRNWDSLIPKQQKTLTDFFETNKFAKGAFARGHNFSSLLGGFVDTRNVSAQINKLNSLLGEDPRYAIELMRQWGSEGGGAQHFYNSLLESEGLGIQGKPNALLQLFADSGELSPDSLMSVQRFIDENPTLNIDANIIRSSIEDGGVNLQKLADAATEASTNSILQIGKQMLKPKNLIRGGLTIGAPSVFDLVTPDSAAAATEKLMGGKPDTSWRTIGGEFLEEAKDNYVQGLPFAVGAGLLSAAGGGAALSAAAPAGLLIGGGAASLALSDAIGTGFTRGAELDNSIPSGRIYNPDRTWQGEAFLQKPEIQVVNQQHRDFAQQMRPKTSQTAATKLGDAVEKWATNPINELKYIKNQALDWLTNLVIE